MPLPKWIEGIIVLVVYFLPFFILWYLAGEDKSGNIRIDTICPK